MMIRIKKGIKWFFIWGVFAGIFVSLAAVALWLFFAGVVLGIKTPEFLSAVRYLYLAWLAILLTIQCVIAPLFYLSLTFWLRKKWGQPQSAVLDAFRLGLLDQEDWTDWDKEQFSDWLQMARLKTQLTQSLVKIFQKGEEKFRSG